MKSKLKSERRHRRTREHLRRAVREPRSLQQEILPRSLRQYPVNLPGNQG
jgi:hypothetical protein